MHVPLSATPHLFLLCLLFAKLAVQARIRPSILVARDGMPETERVLVQDWVQKSGFNCGKAHGDERVIDRTARPTEPNQALRGQVQHTLALEMLPGVQPDTQRAWGLLCDATKSCRPTILQCRHGIGSVKFIWTCGRDSPHSLVLGSENRISSPSSRTGRSPFRAGDFSIGMARSNPTACQSSHDAVIQNCQGKHQKTLGEEYLCGCLKLPRLFSWRDPCTVCRLRQASRP